jgi:hypothetical protein
MKPSDYIRRGWTQGTHARDADGKPVRADSPEAVAWCLTGALHAAYGTLPGVLESAWASVRDIINGDMVDWNDYPRRTKAQVIAALKDAGE